jgi:hypothetical protein
MELAENRFTCGGFKPFAKINLFFNKKGIDYKNIQFSD